MMHIGSRTHNSIFQEPPADLDETWTNGALLRGMCRYGDQDLAESYFRAGSALITAVLENKEPAYDLINPVMYVYRHGLELYLKCIVRPSELNHNVASLLEAFCQHIRDRYGETVPPWITKPISEFAKYDPGSDVFRYEKTRVSRLHNEGEFWIDLVSLRRKLEKIRVAFSRVLRADEASKIRPHPAPALDI
jgi:hypothetical protein